MSTHLILTSSNGTTTKDSVALKTAQKIQRHGDLRRRYDPYPAAQPVTMESCWFIFFSPESPRKVLPQKSLAALGRNQS